MTSLNNILDSYPKEEEDPTDLIELPDDKPPIPASTTIIMNGHHNFNNPRREDEEEEESLQPFLNATKEQSSKDSQEEDSDMEQESSTHLLQERAIEMKAASSSKAKVKSSPSRKADPHPNIQHQPLTQDPLPDVFVHSKRRGWWFACRMALVIVPCILLVLGGCVGFLLYFGSPGDCGDARQWWQRAVMYEVFPASFQDSDGDGFGDFRGLVHRLDHVRKELGVRVLRLNSVFSALDYPLEYEHAIDFGNVDPHLGRMEDFQALVREVHRRGMFVVLDMNPTTTSDQHSWAAHWLLRRPPFQHFYINVTEEEDEEPPLEDNPTHQDKDRPTPHRTFGNHLYLNWSNPLLQHEMQKTLELWLSQGVDGFYMKHLASLHVAENHHLPSILRHWRSILDKHSANSTRKVLMVSHKDVVALEGVVDPATLARVADLVEAGVDLGPNGTVCGEVEDVVGFWGRVEDPPQVVWHTGGVERMRFKRRGDGEYYLATAFLRLVLPGSFSVFYGDEIGLGNSFDPVTNEVYRGGQLTPMQWTSGPQANFTDPDTTPWIPVHPDHTSRNVDGSGEALVLFAKLVQLKEQQSFPQPSSLSTVHTLPVLFKPKQQAAEYQWYYDSSLLVARVVASDLVLLANFGAEPVGLGDAAECLDRHPRCMDPAGFALEPPFQVILATNSSVDGRRIQLKELQLQPGMAIIGRFIT